MKLLVFRALWGMTGTVEQQLEQVAAEGYDGIEGWHHPEVITPEAMRSLLDHYGLKLILGASVRQAAELDNLLDVLPIYAPLRISVHSGLDSMTHEEGCAFFDRALLFEAKAGIPVGHETHRGKLLFTPWDTAYYLTQFPALRVLADFSHWVNVCERLPNDQREALHLACQRAVHVHGRVGFEQGPQVPDPAAPEYAIQLAWHEARWQAIWAAHQQRDEPFMTFTPEYGPTPYLHALPYTNVPVADLSTVCLWAAQRARSIFVEANWGD